MKIVVDSKIPYIRGLVEQFFDTVVYASGADIDRRMVMDADALLVRTRTRVDADLLEGTGVRCVVTATIGTDHINSHDLERLGIAWYNCPGCNATSVAQYVVNSLLNLSLAGRLPGHVVIGIVGHGHVGTAVERALTADGNDPLFGDVRSCMQRHRIELMLCDPYKKPMAPDRYHDLEELCAKCDVFTFHTPLTSVGEYPTLGMAGESFFKRLQRRPVIINAARGGIIDEAAWVAGIDHGLVAEAVVDTWIGEPDIDTSLLHRAFIATPHIAGYSAEGKATATKMSLDALCRHFGMECSCSISLPGAVGVGEGLDAAARRLALYDPMLETCRLKACPSDFELMRNNYPVRRESL